MTEFSRGDKDNSMHFTWNSFDKDDALDCANDLDISLAEFIRQAVREKVRHHKIGQLSVSQRYENTSKPVPEMEQVVSAAVTAALRAYQDASAK
jgi:hypothetical protein